VAITSPLERSPVKNYLLILTLATLLGACASSPQRPPAHLTAEHYTSTASVIDKTSLNAIQVNTEKGYEEPYDVPMNYKGLYLLASIDKKSGKTAIGVDFMQMTNKIREKVVVTYEAPEGTMRQTIYVKRGRAQCHDKDCRYLESISIPLKESLVRYYAQRYSPNLETHWTFHIDNDYTGEIAYAEMAGLIANVDRARKSLPGNVTNAQE
jgi:hypothetical protein